MKKLILESVSMNNSLTSNFKGWYYIYLGKLAFLAQELNLILPLGDGNPHALQKHQYLAVNGWVCCHNLFLVDAVKPSAFLNKTV